MGQKIVYIDWNLYSILKNPTLKPHSILKEFLIANRTKIKQVYSPAHLGDLDQTSDHFADKRIQDLKYLSQQTNDFCIVNYFGSADVVFETRNALEFYETNKTDNSTSIIQALDNGRKIITDNYGQIRDEIIRSHFKTEPSEICNFSKEQLNELIKMIKLANSLDEFLKFGLKLRTHSVDKLSQIDVYFTAYTTLDLISFFPDSMLEKGDFENLKNDAFHSAYGSLCDAFITNDNKCFHKSKFLFNYFESKARLIRTCKIKDTSKLSEDLDRIFD